MKRKSFILLLIVSVFLLTSCTKNYYENKGDKYFDAQDYENAEKYYLKALEKEADSHTYIKLADLHRNNHQYDKEGNTILKGMMELDDPIDLNIRFSQYQTLVGDADKAQISLLHLLYQKFDEELFKEIIKIYLENRHITTIDYYYNEFKDQIKDLETKILAYKAVGPDENLKEELEKELLDSNDIKAYKALIERAYDYHEYEKVEELLPHLESMDGELEFYKIYSQLLAMKDLFIMNKQIGHFINMDYKDLVVIYKNIDNPSHIYLTLMDGKTGEIVIDKIMEDFYPDFIDLDVYETKDELDQLAMTSYYGASASSGKKFSIYEFSKDDFKEIEPNFESDLEIKLLEEFKIQVESKNLNKRYIIEIPKTHRLAYIEDGQYNEEGIPNADNGPRTYGDGYSLRYRGDYKDTISVITGFGGTYSYSAERLGYIDELYNEIDGSFKCTAFKIKDIEGMVRESEFIEGVQVITLSEPEQEKEETETEKIHYPERLIEDDYKLRIGDKTIFVDNNIDYITKLLGSGEVELIEHINEDVSMYEYKIDGLTILYMEKDGPTGKQQFNDTILVDKPGIKTIRGLEVGIDEERLEKLYGLKNLFYEDENESIYLYQEDGYTIHMDLYVVVDKKDKRVIRFNYSTNL
ncbi:tetratricopeptide repeat protein [Schnuerera ultunensis]|uniref:tetratricopeptide repeat protein n=1 Tax=Schnuerera ultunensis TaxID=45497 RepID=UPI00041DC74C|nr:tetratricopeptide repeat protein [Schnuerera ultunensis]